jgi:hypothetical protein
MATRVITSRRRWFDPGVGGNAHRSAALEASPNASKSALSTRAAHVDRSPMDKWTTGVELQKEPDMSDPKKHQDETGSGGSSDGDTQPDDTGATGTFAEHPTGDQKATENVENDPPA